MSLTCSLTISKRFLSALGMARNSSSVANLASTGFSNGFSFSRCVARRANWERASEAVYYLLLLCNCFANLNFD